MKNRKDKMVLVHFGQKHTFSREGGIEVVVNELATRMAAKGHKVICYDRRSKHVSGATLDIPTDTKGVQIIPVWTIDRKGLAAFTSSLVAALRASFSKADVVHIHAEGPAAMAWIPKLFGKRVIVSVHGLDHLRAEKWSGFGRRYIYFGEKVAVKCADEIIVLSKNLQNYFMDKYNRKTVFIPNGVNKPQSVPAKMITEKWGLTKDSYVLFLGRIVPEKGLKYLVQAWNGLKTDIKLVIAGGSSDTKSFMDELKGMSNDNVIFTGFQQGQILEELYSNCYLYCLPSDLEGMPLSLLEAMSYGNCCVVSDIPECAEVVEDKAVVFKRSDVSSLRTTLQDLLDDESRVTDYKNKAADFICSKYNWDDVVDRTLELYQG